VAVVRKGRSITMSAASDIWNAPIKIKQIRFIGTGLTPGQIITLKEADTNGAVIATHPIIAANEDEVIAEMDSWVRKPFIDAAPAAGAWSLLFQLC
jgi:hypothetical protein